MRSSSNISLAVKQVQSKVTQYALDDERLFRLHLLSVLRTDARGIVDTSLFEKTARHYPSDSILHRIQSTKYSDPIEDQELDQLNSLVFENRLLETSGRKQLLELYARIPSAFYFFEDLDTGIDFTPYLRHCNAIARRNNVLHEQFARLTLESNVREPYFDISHPPITDLMDTTHIIEETSRKSAVGLRSISRCLSSRPSTSFDERQIRGRVTSLVQSALSPNDRHSEYAKVERAALLQKARELDQEQLPDLATLRSEHQKILTQFATLLETKRTLQGQVERLRRHKAPKAEVSAEQSIRQDRVNSLNEIIGQNTTALKKTLHQNRDLQRQIQQRNLEDMIPSDLKGHRSHD